MKTTFALSSFATKSLLTIVLLITNQLLPFAQSTIKPHDIIIEKLSQDANLIVKEYGNKKLIDANEKEFLQLMKTAATFSKSKSNLDAAFVKRLSNLATNLGIFANPDEGGEITKKKNGDGANPDEGGEANPDEGGEIFIKNSPATYTFYTRLYKKFATLNKLVAEKKLKLLQ